MNVYWATGVLVFYIFSCALCGILGDKYASEKCKASDEKHDLAESQNTIAAEKKVAAVVQTQETISQEASNEYAKSTAAVTSAYATGVQPSAPGPVNRVPSVCSPARRTAAPRVSKVYKLTAEQCDLEEAKFNALWNWSTRQAAAR